MDNTVYIYQDNFISLLNLIDTLIKQNIKPLNIKNTFYSPTLLDNIIYLDIKENNCLIKEFVKNYNIFIFNIMYNVFISNHDNKELIIYYFYLNTLKYGKNIIYKRNLKCVSLALKISKHVGGENHRFKGITRFKELENNILYSEINPDNDILFLLSKHFKERLKNEYWIIKDVNRKMYSIYDKNNFYLINEENFEIKTKNISLLEKNIQEMWKDFYNTIGIKTRKNERCRMNFMPKKYWKYITEVSEEYEKSS